MGRYTRGARLGLGGLMEGAQVLLEDV